MNEKSRKHNGVSKCSMSKQFVIYGICRYINLSLQVIRVALKYSAGLIPLQVVLIKLLETVFTRNSSETSPQKASHIVKKIKTF